MKDRKDLADNLAQALAGRVNGVSEVGDDFPGDDTGHAGFTVTAGNREFAVRVYDVIAGPIAGAEEPEAEEADGDGDDGEDSQS